MWTQSSSLIWTWAVDLALTPIAVVAAMGTRDYPWLIVATLPLIGLLAYFARERQVRIDHALELSTAYRGTALLLGEVVSLVLDVCDRLGVNGAERRDAEFAALLYDDGKIKIPAEIINKPGKLTDEEFELIKTHTVEGERLLGQVGGLLGNVGRIVRSCHEDWDGTGYPDGLSGLEIPRRSHLRCCDAFSAMTTDRSYRRALPVEDAIAELHRCSGRDFDPNVVGALSVSMATARHWFQNSRAAQECAVEQLARIGLAAKGVSYGLVAVLAIELALGRGGKATDRTGALRTIAHDPIGRAIVIALAVGFACYALWRLGEAVREDKLSKRLTALGKAAIYGALCWTAVSILLGEDKSSGNKEKEATAGVLGWPGGQWIVIAVALAIGGAALWNVYRGLSGRFMKDMKTGEMSPGVRTWTTRIGLVGHVARGIVFGLIAWFFFKAAVDYNANKAEGLDGALRKLVHQDYGTWLLSIVAAGLFAYGVFCLLQARYREI